jgi:hypothetical protein
MQAQASKQGPSQSHLLEGVPHALQRRDPVQEDQAATCQGQRYALSM